MRSILCRALFFPSFFYDNVRAESLGGAEWEIGRAQEAARCRGMLLAGWTTELWGPGKG